MSSLKVLSLSLANDEKFLNNHLKDSKKTDDVSPKDISATRNKVARSVIATIIDKTQPDIMCLQKMKKIDENIIQNWVGDDYRVKTNGKDTAIAFKTRFTCSKAHTSENSSFIILSIQDEQTKKTYNVASSCFSITNLEDPATINPNVARNDQEEFREFLATLNEMPSTAEGTIIGLSTNNDQARFTILEKAGFQTSEESIGKEGLLNYIFASKAFKFSPSEPLDIELEDQNASLRVYEKLEYVGLENSKVEKSTFKEEIIASVDVENDKTDSEKPVEQTQGNEELNQLKSLLTGASPKTKEPGSDQYPKEPSSSLNAGSKKEKKVSFGTLDEIPDSSKKPTLLSPPPKNPTHPLDKKTLPLPKNESQKNSSEKQKSASSQPDKKLLAALHRELKTSPLVTQRNSKKYTTDNVNKTNSSTAKKGHPCMKTTTAIVAAVVAGAYLWPIVAKYYAN